MKRVPYIICSMLFVWLVASYIDVSLHNMSDCKYQRWNAFNLFDGEKEVEAKEVELPQIEEKLNELHEMTVSEQELKLEDVVQPTKYYTKSNVILLAKLIQAENGGAKHDETLYLTGAVVMKRVKSKHYPNTIREVIYQKGQYSTASRLDSVKPSTRALEIANDILVYGVDELPDNLVFQAMFEQGKEVYKKIDGEYFCLA